MWEETDYVVVAEHPVYGVFELGCWMCGFDDFLLRVAGDPDFVRRFFDIALDLQKRFIQPYYQAVGEYIHLTTSGDDFGMQTGPLISPRAVPQPGQALLRRADRLYPPVHPGVLLAPFLRLGACADPRPARLRGGYPQPGPAGRVSHGTGAAEGRLRQPAVLPRRF